MITISAGIESLPYLLGTLPFAYTSLSIRREIDSRKMDTDLKNMGMNLTEKELKDLTQNLPIEGEHF